MIKELRIESKNYQHIESHKKYIQESFNGVSFEEYKNGDDFVVVCRYEVLPDIKTEIVSAIKDGREIVSSLFEKAENYEERWAICESCEFLTETKRCLKCGCFMKIKSRFQTMKCPIQKW